MMINLLPTVNAILNSISALLIVTGYFFIRRKKVGAHRACMISAIVTSILFLISYLIYHYHHGATRFPGSGLARAIYLTILVSHTTLAVAIIPLIAITLYRAASRQFARHLKIARLTFPLWLYVSITGVAVYLMLYHFYSPS
jgi:uncharacterized membrane protein YozB (DUF420 family)